MPQINVVKTFRPQSFYHVYNRSGLRLQMFPKHEDFLVYQRCLFRALDKYDGEIRIVSRVLMPNHYHFLLWQNSPGSMTSFMRSLSTSYARYLMKKYGHTGHLYECSYKAVLLPNQQDVVRILQYIRKNAIEAGLINWRYQGGEWFSFKELEDGWQDPRSYISGRSWERPP